MMKHLQTKIEILVLFCICSLFSIGLIYIFAYQTDCWLHIYCFVLIKRFTLYILLLAGISAVGQEVVSTDLPKMPSIRTEKDSLLNNPALLSDSLAIQNNLLLNDSLAVTQPDSTKTKKPVLEAEIKYNATDSIITDMENQKVYLYKDGVVTYQSIELKADYIALDLNNKEIYAEGLPDSTGTIVGTPVFKDGDEEFESKTLRYNFETQKGIITDVKTTQGDGIVHSERTKKISDDAFILKRGKYSTCDADHPHFYLRMTRAKVITNKKIITGPAYMVLEDFPIYFPLIPFGYFPNSTKYSSGILIPTYGEEQNRGFFLRDGGYYWAAGQYFDLTLKGSVYSKGSWGADVGTSYKKRYKYNGRFNFKYNSNKYSEDAAPSNGFSLQWSHSQDSKANPNRTFSASVNLSSTSYDKENSLSAQNYLQTTKSSSISYTQKIENSPFNYSINLRHSQNSQNKTLSLSLPEMTFNVAKIYPFRRKERAGKAQWYEKIGFSYTGNIKNSITAQEDEILKKSLVKDWKNGWQHSIPISLPNFNLFKYINISPSFSYSERWYTNYLDANYIKGETKETSQLKVDTLYAFKRNYNYSYALSASTNLYGMYTMKNPNSKIKQIRHKITPSLSFSYTPDFGAAKFGFWQEYVDYDGVVHSFNRYQNGIFGSAGQGESGSINFSLANNLEAKMLDVTDSTKTDKTDKEVKFKKVKILDNLSMSASYNLIADSLNMSMISIRGRTTIKGVSINFGGNLDPYNVDRTGKRYHEYMWNAGKGLNKLGRLTSANMSFGMSFQSKKGQEEAAETKAADEENQILPGGYDQYYDFNIPWDFRFDYSLTYTNPFKPNTKASIMQSLNFGGRLSLTENWRLSMNTNFDVQAMKFSFTNFTVSRELHCWAMSFNFIPFGARKSYSFTLNAKSSMLKDLKLEKQRSWFDNN